MGTTTSQIIEVLNGHLHLKISEGGLTEIWHRLANVLTPWYDQILTECPAAPVLHADETGWRLKGQTWWLWCAATPCSTYYWIDASRGHAALNAFFEEEFAGVMVTDFWKAYDAFALTPSERLLNYVELAGVDPTNNKAEREIRPAVLMRKASYGSMSEPGSVTRSVLTSIYRTLKQRVVDHCRPPHLHPNRNPPTLAHQNTFRGVRGYSNSSCNSTSRRR